MDTYEFQFFFLPAMLCKRLYRIGRLDKKMLSLDLRMNGKNYDLSGLTIENHTDGLDYTVITFPEAESEPLAYYVLVARSKEGMRYITLEKGSDENFICELEKDRHMVCGMLPLDCSKDEFVAQAKKLIGQ